MLEDITPTIASFLDPHLTLLLLDHSLSGSNSNSSLLETKLSLLSRTRLVGAQQATHQALHKSADTPAQLKDLHAATVAQLRSLSQQSQEIVDANVNSNKPLSKTDVETIAGYAKFAFDCGRYDDALGTLNVCLEHAETTNKMMRLGLLWGKVAAEVLLHKSNDAKDTLLELRSAIDDVAETILSPRDAALQRAWLLHYFLFVHKVAFSKAQTAQQMAAQQQKPDHLLVDWVLNNPTLLQTLQSVCPHLLRYLAASALAVRSAKRREPYVMQVAQICQLCESSYSDDLTRFIVALYVNCSVHASQPHVHACISSIRKDYFLNKCADEVIDAMRTAFCESWFRLHTTSSIADVAERVAWSGAGFERWIVDVIRTSRLDAKIDSEGVVHVRVPQFSLYQDVIDKTKSLAARWHALNRQQMRS
jgi:translation initiation factor 3 subunit E